MNFNNSVKVLKTNQVYRFGDLFYRRGIRWQNDRNIILNSKQYNNTILRDYLNYKKKEEDYQTLKSIALEHIKNKKYKTPEEDELVIHFRCGDIFSEEDYISKKYIIDQFDFFKNNIFNKKKSLLNSSLIKKVTVVTALHYGSNEINGLYFYNQNSHNRSFEFLNFIENEIKYYGHDMNVFSNFNIDLDFCYMISSKYFFGKVGGISNIINTCNKYLK